VFIERRDVRVTCDQHHLPQSARAERSTRVRASAMVAKMKKMKQLFPLLAMRVLAALYSYSTVARVADCETFAPFTRSTHELIASSKPMSVQCQRLNSGEMTHRIAMPGRSRTSPGPWSITIARQVSASCRTDSRASGEMSVKMSSIASRAVQPRDLGQGPFQSVTAS
jgi:hypothetical protein